ncbi:MAG TPA: aspartyl protease family protein [Acidimicrobiales bacterium]|nr:aspartyl protease family protein [Acidimicrobiales bacterium]
MSAPLRVFETPERITVAASVTVARHTEQLAVDTGSAASGLVPSVVTRLNLKAHGSKVGYAGVACNGNGPTYSSGKWAVGGTSLRDAPLVTRPLAGSGNSGLQGVLGSDVLASHGSVIVDYSGAHLWLTTG